MSIKIRSLNDVEIESLLQQGCSSSLVVEDHHGFQQLIKHNSWDKVLVRCDETTMGINESTNLSWLRHIQRSRFRSFDSSSVSQFVDELLGLGSITLNGVLISSSNKAALSGAIILGRFSTTKILIAESVKNASWFHGLAVDLPGEN